MKFIGEKGLRLATNGATKEDLNQLPERWRKVIEWNFGLTGERPLTYNVIGARLGISRQAVQQLRLKALKRLNRGRELPPAQIAG